MNVKEHKKVQTWSLDKIGPCTSCQHSALTLSLKRSRPPSLNQPEAVACLSPEEQTSANSPCHNGSVFSLRDGCDNKCTEKRWRRSRSTTKPTVLRWESLLLFSELEDVDGLIHTYSLTIHSFVPFQQFMSDKQKLDYQGDMSRLCQRQIRGWSLAHNI